MKRRDFVKVGGITVMSAPILAESMIHHSQTQFDPLNEKGIHPILKGDVPYTFIDSCMQIWPDAQFEKAHLHGVTSYGVTAWDPHDTVEQALEGMMYWHFITRKYPDLSIAYTVDDIREAKNNRKALLLLASQCGDFIGSKLHRIEAFYRLGLRMLIPTYSLSNRICGGCLDRTDSGLTSFGRLVIEECNRLGLLLDCSHLSRRSSLDIIELSTSPVVFSHSCSKELADNPRNIDNQQIKKCASKNGVIGLSPWGPMTLHTGRKEHPTLDDFIDHIDHVAQLLGTTGHIGVGTDMSLGTYPDHDYDIWGEPEYKDVTSVYNENITANIRSPLRMVKGFSNYGEVPNFFEALQKRGYKDSDIRGILGENYLRVFEQVWK